MQIPMIIITFLKMVLGGNHWFHIDNIDHTYMPQSEHGNVGNNSHKEPTVVYRADYTVATCMLLAVGFRHRRDLLMY